MKIIKTKTDSGLQIYCDCEIVALFCNDTIYLSFDKFKGILQIGLPADLSNWNEDNILTFGTIEECRQHIEINNLTKYTNLNDEEIM